MEEFKLCFFEELAESGGKNCYLQLEPSTKLKLCNNLTESKDEIFNAICSGKWMEVLESEDFKDFLLQGSENFDKNKKLGIAVAALLAFSQDNFTGPDITVSSIRFKSFDGDNRWNVDKIAVDGIEWNANIRNIALLIVSRNFLEDLSASFKDDLVSRHLLTLVTVDSYSKGLLVN